MAIGTSDAGAGKIPSLGTPSQPVPEGKNVEPQDCCIVPALYSTVSPSARKCQPVPSYAHSSRKHEQGCASTTLSYRKVLLHYLNFSPRLWTYSVSVACRRSKGSSRALSAETDAIHGKSIPAQLFL